jgi:phosphoribosyl 1,2-cyclic phosphodiesterase
MKLIFLGTRGNTLTWSRRHRRHSALMVCCGRARAMVDCGADWLGRIEALRPGAIVITHAHPDHAGGLAQGAPCPVFTTAESWRLLAGLPIRDRRIIEPRSPIRIADALFEAFALDHSLRAPAVGYRITAGGRTLFYAPDVVNIRERSAALAGIDLYVGDGATVLRPMIRRRDKGLIGHATVRDQLGWCSAEGVRRALFTHCGSGIVAGDERRLGAQLRGSARRCGVDARFAFDGLEITLS